MSGIRRRDVLTGAAIALAGGAAARASVIQGIGCRAIPCKAGSLPTSRATRPMGSLTGPLDDAQVAAVATYVRNSWGHAAGRVPESAARAARSD